MRRGGDTFLKDKFEGTDLLQYKYIFDGVWLFIGSAPTKVGIMSDLSTIHLSWPCPSEV